MAQAQRFIETVHKVGEKGGELERVYRRMLNRDLFLNAYGKLYSNKGAMTKGVDPKDTVQGMSRRRVDRIIEKLQNKTYQWQPARRVRIPKKNGKTRPLGIPTWNDKLVQEVIRTVLEAYYEPQFSEHSHGFRPKRGCHTALREIGKWHGTKWFIEGDIKGCFDNIDHDKLLEVIGRKVKDDNLLKLLEQMLKSGYMQEWNYHDTYSGTPQGGVISPLLANIMLNELDRFVENELIPEYNKGKGKKINPEYNRLRQAAFQAKKKGNKEQHKLLKCKMQQIPSVVTDDPEFRRLKYVRYADDFILGFIGTKAEAVEIKQKIAEFLQTINLTMSEEKTLITNATKDRARFLGYEIYTALADERRAKKKGQSRTKRRAINGQIMFSVPKDVIGDWSRRFNRKGKAAHRTYLIECSDYEIVQTYGLELQGLINYYTMAYDVSRLMKVKYHFMMSLVKTIAAKHKKGTKWVLKRYRRKSQDNITAIIVEIPNPKNPNKPLKAKFGGKPMRYTKYATIDDSKAQFYHGRNELVQRLLADKCELCGATDEIRGHHVNKLADVKKKYKGQKYPPQWAVFMMERNRKVVFVCHQCHTKIHAGRYDGVKVKQRFTGELGATETGTLSSEGGSWKSR